MSSLQFEIDNFWSQEECKMEVVALIIHFADVGIGIAIAHGYKFFKVSVFIKMKDS